jgi:hypothetical protein
LVPISLVAHALNVNLLLLLLSYKTCAGQTPVKIVADNAFSLALQSLVMEVGLWWLVVGGDICTTVTFCHLGLQSSKQLPRTTRVSHITSSVDELTRRARSVGMLQHLIKHILWDIRLACSAATAHYQTFSKSAVLKD